MRRSHTDAPARCSVILGTLGSYGPYQQQQNGSPNNGRTVYIMVYRPPIGDGFGIISIQSHPVPTQVMDGL